MPRARCELLGGRVAWILTAADGTDRDWSFMNECLMSPQRRARRLAGLARGSEGYALWPALETQPGDLTVVKRRYSAFIQGSSSLERELRSGGIDTVLISGTSTNVCCESTARDAMMLDFRTVMLADALAAQNAQTHVGGAHQLPAAFRRRHERRRSARTNVRRPRRNRVPCR